MKKLLTLTVILYSLIFSSVSFGEWTEVGESEGGDIFYVDFDTVRVRNDYIYYWKLQDYIAPRKIWFSMKGYTQVDCNAFRSKTLTYIAYTQSMGKGTGETVNRENPPWKYHPPNSVMNDEMTLICEQYSSTQ